MCRKYSMMKLKTTSEAKPPENPIYNHGANIVPICCPLSQSRQPECLKSPERNLITNTSENTIIIKESILP
jgi:hypothetical protein